MMKMLLSDIFIAKRKNKKQFDIDFYNANEPKLRKTRYLEIDIIDHQMNIHTR